MGLEIGDSAINFNLKGIDGKTYSLDSFKGKKILVIIFSCNHCPYVRAYEDRIKQIQKDYKDNVQVVCINSNNDKNYPEDSYKNMIKRAKEKKYNFPYLRDDTQEVARAYGGEVTPDVFVFSQNRTLEYRGRIDDNWENPDDVTSDDLRNALNEMLAGEEIKVKDVRAIGCSIKWK